MSKIKKLIAYFEVLIILVCILGYNIIDVLAKPYSLKFEYEIIPETFEIKAKVVNKEIIISKPTTRKKITQFNKSGNLVSWVYPNEKIKVELLKSDDELSVSITYLGSKDFRFSWPCVAHKNYIIPFGEGKHFKNDDKNWKKYLINNPTFDTTEFLSMAFLAGGNNELAVIYILDNNFDNELKFDKTEKITFSISHEYPQINTNKTNRFLIHITENNPVNIAKTYKEYIVKNGMYRTLKEKSHLNENIKKLYGAIHIYLFDMNAISEEDVKWNKFKRLIEIDQIKWLKILASKHLDDGDNLNEVIEEIKCSNDVNSYQKSVICQGISNLLQLPNFYNKKFFPVQDNVIKSLMQKGIKILTDKELVKLNKHVLYSNLSELFRPVSTWADSRTVDIINAMKKSGIKRAWVGLNDWRQAYIKPELVKTANEVGYLIAPYDSYNSIHEHGKERWITSIFDDTTLYDNATIENKKNKKISGFLEEGRHLNPIMALPSVKSRVNKILNNIPMFNSWFVDCDAAGEIFNDYAPTHITTKKEDLKARLERLTYISEVKKLVVGSESGNDFAANVIAFAHGIELPTFSWIDEDMKNKDSRYYVGSYYSPTGSIPSMMIKPIPVKEEHKHIFLDIFYTIPLYKLVYNDSVITSCHWEWATLKICGEERNRMLCNVLYNTPPMYHIDKFEWMKNSKLIIDHAKEWSNISKKIINMEMTNFSVLSHDRLIQMAEYGNSIKIIANFSNQDFKYKKKLIKTKSFIVV